MRGHYSDYGRREITGQRSHVQAQVQFPNSELNIELQSNSRRLQYCTISTKCSWFVMCDP